MRGGMTRHLRLDVGRASWGCSDRRGGSCFAHLPRECETAFMSVVGSDDRPGGWSYACIAGLFRMSRCRWDIVKLRWDGLITSQRLARSSAKLAKVELRANEQKGAVDAQRSSRLAHERTG